MTGMTHFSAHKDSFWGEREKGTLGRDTSPWSQLCQDLAGIPMALPACRPRGAGGPGLPSILPAPAISLSCCSVLWSDSQSWPLLFRTVSNCPLPVLTGHFWMWHHSLSQTHHNLHSAEGLAEMAHGCPALIAGVSCSQKGEIPGESFTFLCLRVCCYHFPLWASQGSKWGTNWKRNVFCKPKNQEFNSYQPKLSEHHYNFYVMWELPFWTPIEATKESTAKLWTSIRKSKQHNFMWSMTLPLILVWFIDDTTEHWTMCYKFWNQLICLIFFLKENWVSKLHLMFINIHSSPPKQNQMKAK